MPNKKHWCASTRWAGSTSRREVERGPRVSFLGLLYKREEQSNKHCRAPLAAVLSVVVRTERGGELPKLDDDCTLLAV